MNIAIVATELPKEFVDRMVEFGKRYVMEKGAKIICVVRVPGLLEIPIFTRKLMSREDVDGVAVFGAVIKETSLEEFIFNQIISKLLDFSLEFDKSVGVGIAGPGIFWSEKLRAVGAEEYARIALDAVLRQGEGLQ